jgi:hypothetical protein
VHSWYWNTCWIYPCFADFKLSNSSFLFSYKSSNYLPWFQPYKNSTIMMSGRNFLVKNKNEHMLITLYNTWFYYTNIPLVKQSLYACDMSVKNLRQDKATDRKEEVLAQSALASIFDHSLNRCLPRFGPLVQSTLDLVTSRKITSNGCGLIYFMNRKLET